MRLGDIIHRYRDEHEMSMGEFAKLAGVSKAYIGFLEKGINPKTGRDFAPSIKTIQSVAKAMRMDFDTLFNMLDGEVTLSVNSEQSDLTEEAKAGDELSPAARELIDLMHQLEPEQIGLLLAFAKALLHRPQGS